MAGKPGRPRKEQPIADATPLRNAEQVVEAVETQPTNREAMSQARDDTREGRGRRNRRPLGVPTQRLQADVPRGMTGRWMNDTPGRLMRAVEAEYRRRGVNRSFVGEKNHRPCGRLYRVFGYAPVETHYSKMIGGRKW